MMLKTKNLFVFVILFFCLPFSGKAEKESSIVRKAEYYYLEGIRLKNAKKIDGAFEMFQYASEVDPSAPAALFELSRFYLQSDRPDQALSLLKRAVAIDSTNFEYQILYASISQMKGDVSEAIRVYKDLAASHPDKPELSYYLGQLYAGQKEYMKAIEAFNDLEQSFGVSESISILKYKLYEAAGEEENAFAEIEKLIKKYPFDINYVILLGNLYLEKGQYEKAYEYYQQAEKVDPDNPDLLVDMVNYYDIIGDTMQSMQLIEKALANPNVEINHKLGILSRYINMLLRTQKEVESANSLFELLLEQHPQEIKLHQFYGEFLLSQGKNDDAKFQFQLVTEMEPSLLNGWLQLLGVYLQENDTDNAVLVIRKAQAYHPESLSLYYFFTSVYYQKKEMQQALRIAEEGLKKARGQNKDLLSSYYAQMGDLYYQLGKKEKAFDFYEKGLAENPDNIMLLNNYAYFLSLENRDLKKAEEMSGRSVVLEPNNSTYLDTYAWIFYMQGNYVRARIYIENAISNGGGDTPEILEHYGDILFKLGDREGAVREWQKAWELNGSKGLKRKIKKETGENPKKPTIESVTEGSIL